MSGGVIRINGWDIPVQPYDSDGVGGESERAVDLSPQLSMRRGVRQHSFTTSDLSAADAEGLRVLLTPGDTDLWPLNASPIWSGLSKAVETGGVYSLRPIEGKFGTGGTAVEPGETNLLSSTEQAFAGWTAVSGASVPTPAGGFAIPNVTTNAAYRVLTSGGSSVIKYQITKSGATVGLWCGVSVYVSVPSTATESVVVSVPNLTVMHGTGSMTVAPGQTVRFWVVGTNTATSRTLRFSSTSVGAALDFYAYQPMIADQSHAGSFSIGTRVAGSLAVASYTSGQSGTEAFWYTPQQATSNILSQATSPAIATLGNYLDPQSWRLWAFTSGTTAEPNLAFYLRGSTAPSWSVSPVIKASGSGWYVPGTPTHFGITNSGSVFTIYVNGLPSTPITVPDPFNFPRGAKLLNLGTNAGAMPGNGVYHGRVTSAYALGPSAMLALASRTSAIPSFPYVECTGSAFDGRTVNCIPVGLPKVKTMAGDGTWRQVEFTLEEVPA